jgi:hypothetical protein
MLKPAEFKNPEQEIERFQRRLAVAGALVLLAFFLLFTRFFWLQVVQHEHYRTRAEDNRISLVPIVPNRGVIVDRNGVVLARNYSAYTLEITPGKVADLEAVINALAGVVDIQPKDRKRFRKLLEESQELRVAADPHPPDRRGGGALHRPALPLPGRRDQGAAVPPVSAGRTRFACPRLHRPGERPRPEAPSSGRAERTTTAAPSTSARPGWSRSTSSSCTARPASSRSRSMPAAGPCAAWRAPRRCPATTWC